MENRVSSNVLMSFLVCDIAEMLKTVDMTVFVNNSAAVNLVLEKSESYVSL